MHKKARVLYSHYNAAPETCSHGGCLYENMVNEEGTEWQHCAVCVGEGQAASCLYNIEKPTVGHITVEITNSDIRSDIYVMPTEDPKTYVAWIHQPGENTMLRMFAVRHLNDWAVEHFVIEYYPHDIVTLLTQHSEEDANRISEFSLTP